MKKTIVSTNRLMFVALSMMITIAANAARPLVACYQRDARMSYKTAKNEALFLTDKMAYELNLTDAQYEAVYEINLDYMMSVSGRNDTYGKWWNRRNTDLQYVLTAYQYNKYVGIAYFYRPLTWNNGSWIFNVYTHYSNKSHFYKGHPKGYVSYKGGNNKKSANYYADRKPKNDNNGHGNGPTRRNTNKNDRNTASKSHGHNNNHQLAQNNNRGNNNGHFGGHR